MLEVLVRWKAESDVIFSFLGVERRVLRPGLLLRALQLWRLFWETGEILLINPLALRASTGST